jgi:hypothetical protein
MTTDTPVLEAQGRFLKHDIWLLEHGFLTDGEWVRGKSVDTEGEIERRL